MSHKKSKLDPSNGTSLIAYQTLRCEWTGCNESFVDRTLYLSHINRFHANLFRESSTNQDLIKNDESNRCRWLDCDDLGFVSRESFQLHLSFHAYHNQIMNIGLTIMENTVPTPRCTMDGSSRNVLVEIPDVLLCGWNECCGEFYDAETFFLHVDMHALEDVTIPVMSKEKLKRVKFAKCQWVGCRSAFKTKSCLKKHLASHTQKKMVACPVCGITFTSRMGLLNHCYRQETPTDLTKTISNNSTVVSAALNSSNPLNSSSSTSNPNTILNQSTTTTTNLLKNKDDDNDDEEEEEEEEPEGILTIDEDNENPVGSSTYSTQLSELLPVQSQVQAPIELSNSVVDEPTTVVVRQFRCTFCPKSFDTRSLLFEHQSRHERRFTCPHCPYAGAYESHLREHILFRHCERREFRCKFCSQSFKSKRHLRNHVELHDADQQPLSCQFCDHLYSTSYMLNRHIRISHLNETIVFECHLCDKVYNRGCNLSRHLVKSHRLQIAKGWSRFIYEKDPKDLVYRINPQCWSQ